MALFGFVFGAFARSESWWRDRAFVAGSVTAIAFTAVALVSYAIAPDWMWMYFLDPSDVTWAVPFVALGYLFVFAIAFAASVALTRTSSKLPWAFAAGCLVFEAVVLALTWERYRSVGSAAEWARGGADELLTLTPAGDARTISFLLPVFGVVFLLSLLNIRRGRRRV